MNDVMILPTTKDTQRTKARVILTGNYLSQASGRWVDIVQLNKSGTPLRTQDETPATHRDPTLQGLIP